MNKTKPMVVMGLLFQACALQAVPLVDSEPLDHGFRQMYNLQFADAHQTFEGYSKAHPEDPLGHVANAAAYLFSEFDRLKILQSEFWVEDQPFLDMRKPAAD